jgi:UDP-N-acetylmuramyl pentapeptide phosphotransferase/UDP-N-acetylglucosamine-1-phosphate transferase
VSAFGHFWWEFLVGDTPELLAGAVIAVGVVALLAHQGAARVVVVGALPVLVIIMLGASVRRAQRVARKEQPSEP